MSDAVGIALQLAREMRRMPQLAQIDPSTRRKFEHNLAQLEATLSGQGHDPYATVTSLLEDQLRESAGGGSSGDGSPPSAAKSQPPAPPAAPPAAPSTEVIGERARTALEAVDFPGFVASLVTGTFKAIVDASAQQITKYAELVQSITQSLEEFSDKNVTPNQARDDLANKFSQDLMIQFPAPGKDGTPQLLPRPEREGESPTWLAKYDLAGEQLTADLTDGRLVEKARLRVGEDRLQMLATLVLMGINRIVVNEGDIRAKLQFHAVASDVQKAHVDQMNATIAQKGTDAASGTQMLVSTIKANAQADASIKTDLMGEVRISFRSETFPLERFADSAAITLLNRHARWKQNAPANTEAAAPAHNVATQAATSPPASAASPAAPAHAGGPTK
jgi:hypothetical protein